MTKNSQHVFSNSKGGWDVRKSGSERASKHFDTQREAIQWAKIVAKNQKAELYVHGKDGKIREKNSYASHPRPLKD